MPTHSSTSKSPKVAPPAPGAAAQRRAKEAFQHALLPFEANLGQTDPRAKYLARGAGYTVFFTEKSVVLRLADPDTKDRDNVLEMKLSGARATQVQGVQPLASRSHYYHGNSPNAWHGDVPHYGKVSYPGVYRDTDLVFYGRQGELEYDVVLGPGADQSKVELQFSGAKELRVNQDGDLVLVVGNGHEILQRRPKIYQREGASKKEIAGSYRLLAGNRVRFNVGSYDREKPLVIDPILVYSSYLGGSGSGNDVANGIAIDGAGNAYIAGYTTSNSFPTGQVGPIQANRTGGNDAFVASLSADGSTLRYSTYLGGTGDESATAIAVDSAGNAYVVGSTSSTDFPATPGAYHHTSSGGTNAFAAKINAGGGSLAYATYLGPGTAAGVAVDGSGNAYVTGVAYYSFPVTAGAYQTISAGYDAFVTKLNATGSGLIWSTLLGGSDTDSAASIAVDASLNVYIAGSTYSSDFPVTSGAAQAARRGYQDGFIAKFNSAGSALSYSTYLGGSQYDYLNAVAVDSAGYAYVAGYTYSADFPTTAGSYQTLGSYTDAVVTKVNQTGTSFVYSTYLGSYTNATGIAVDSGGDAYITVNGGTLPVTTGAYNGCCGTYLSKLNPAGTSLVYSSQFPYSNFTAVALDGSGNAYLAGSTSSSSYPITSGAYQPSFSGGGTDAIVTKLNSSGSGLIYSTYLGGNGGDQGYGVALDSSLNTYVTGSAGSLDFPVTTEAAKSPTGPYTQTFVTKFNPSGTALLFSTFVGGSGNDIGRAIAIDSTGAVYVTGQTSSSDFPVTAGTLQSTIGGGYDAFLYKLNSLGRLSYSTYLGGSASDDGRSLAVDSSGNAYVAGSTASANFPATVTLGTGYYTSGFVAKINPTASGLVYSTKIGGNSDTQVNGIALHASSGSVFFGGSTYSYGFPVTNGAFQASSNGGYQSGFVSRLNAAGNALLYSTLLHGSRGDSVNAIAVDTSGIAYVTGSTYSPDFPVTAGAYQPNLAGNQNAFVSALNATGSALLYSTYLGGSSNDYGTSLAVDLSGNVHIGGYTQSGNFPIVNGTTIMELTRPNYYSTAFVASLDPTGSNLRYSTYIGGSTVTAIAAQGLGGSTTIAIAGTTSSSSLIGSSLGYQAALGSVLPSTGTTQMIASGATNAFVAKLQETSCSPTVSPQSFNFGPNGGTGTVNVTLPSSCTFSPWVAAPDSDGLVSFNPPSPTAFTSSGSINFSMRSYYGAGNIAQFTVAGSIITVTQTGSCGLSLQPSSATHGPGALTGAQVAVSLTNSSCSWSAYTTTPWITLNSYYYGYGPGTATYSLLPNPSAGSRVGYIYIGPQVFTVTQLGTGATRAFMNSPAPGTTFTDTTATFTWNPVAGASAYWVYVGSTAGGSDLCSSGTLTTTLYTCSSLPTNGSTVYVRLATLVSSIWQTMDYTYTAASFTLAQLTNPAPLVAYPGPPTTTLGGTSATFTWSKGIGADLYWLDVGTAYRSGNLCAGSTSSLSSTCSALPCNGSTIYAQLWTHYPSSGWQTPKNYVYQACLATTAVLTTPTPGSTLAGSTVTFKWNSVAGASYYWLDVGTVLGQGNICGVSLTTNQYTCSNIPTNGNPIYVQLFTYINGGWQPPNRYTFTAAQMTNRAQLTSPLTANLPGTSTNFAWNAISGADQYWLDVGTTPGQGNVCAVSTSGTSFTCNGIPPTASITSPSPGSQLSSSANFCWTPRTLYVQLWTHFPGTGWQTPIRYTYSAPASDYWLDVGTVSGQGNIFGGVISGSTCKAVTLPTGNPNIYVQLYTRVPAATGTWFGPLRYTYVGQ